MNTTIILVNVEEEKNIYIYVQIKKRESDHDRKVKAIPRRGMILYFAALYKSKRDGIGQKKKKIGNSHSRKISSRRHTYNDYLFFFFLSLPSTLFSSN